jgi:hypothetical protein
MLQALGINSRSLDSATKARRLLLFWTLNTIDKDLALMFGRPPTLHRFGLPLIPVQKMLDYQPHASGSENESFASTFGAHHMRVMHSRSIIQADMWNLLFENDSKFEEVAKELDDWYQQSKSVIAPYITLELVELIVSGA